MTEYKLTLILLLVIAMTLPATAATSYDAITTSQIAAAISSAGMKTSAGQVSLLTTVVARTSSPVLKVQSIELWGGHSVRVRLDCMDNNECLPFYVSIRDESDIPPKLSTIVPAMFRPPLISEDAREPIAVRAGSPAVLFLDGTHMHIEIAVICLEKGAIGQTIRVISRDHRRIYSAEVFDGGILKGGL